MRTKILSILLLAAATCSGQDVPSWWPPRLHPDSVEIGSRMIYERPLANYDDPLTGEHLVLVALRDPRTGRFWRAVAAQRDTDRACVGDTITVSTELP